MVKDEQINAVSDTISTIEDHTSEADDALTRALMANEDGVPPYHALSDCYEQLTKAQRGIERALSKLGLLVARASADADKAKSRAKEKAKAKPKKSPKKK